MAIKLSTLAKLAKNELCSGTAFLILLKIELPGLEAEDNIHVVANTEDIYWCDQLYQAFPFQIGTVKEDGSGSIPSVELKVDNTTRDIEYWLNHGGGGVNAKVTLYVVLSTALDNPVPELQEVYSVTDATASEQWVTFSLGNSYPSQARRPWDTYKKNNCAFRYKGPECACTSDLEGCNHTLADCRARGNSKRFGGFPGIDQGGLYV